MADPSPRPVSHQPVMLRETLEYLDPQPGDTMVDVTLGSGGHAGRIAEKIGPSGHLIGLDLDPEAIGRCRSISTGWPCRVNLVQAPSDELERVLRDLDIEKVDGILADLGVSSPQIDQGSRGFSFQKAGPLDMRMDPDAPLSAAGFLASASEQEIRDILRKYGEELRAHAIAKAIARERNLGPIETTDHLTRVILSCFPDRARAGKVHPATRSFQALRILVNRELERLEMFLETIPGCLAERGRVVILAYHSLEDRLVKQTFLEWSGKSDPILARIPIRGELAGWAALQTPKAVRPEPEEVEQNPRARSARLRSVIRRQTG
ncbi:MAG: 16S rRNA (cytosine(1402)-N(4))-methyltransferase RsmH [Candidatus Omnitrophica bacterium]|nr:16S rRNA (cytosine(1402)-N(4))-methyltransferase RsmH [Candidatus Omnitrophota bacterium]